MATPGDMLSQADRRRLAGRLAELRELDRLMREPGTLAAPRRATAKDTAKEVPDSAKA